jgi:rod shape-determining protein MreC
MIGPGSNTQAPLFAGGRPGTLKLVVLLALAIMLMLADRQRGFLIAVRERALALTAPVYRLASLPASGIELMRLAVRDRDALANENRALREALLITQTELHQRRSEGEAHARVLALVEATRRQAVAGTLVRVVDLDLDPFRHRLLLDRGSDAGLARGDGLIDALGVVGQVSAAGASTAFAILITDPSHALPVEVSRNGVKSIAYGTGDAGRLALRNLPLSVDLSVGDRLLTTAVGGRFAAGIPVAEIIAVERPTDAAFAIAYARPLSALGRNRELLAVKPIDWVGPPDPDVPPAANSATPAAADDEVP